MAWQQACTDEDLEAVADAQDRAARVDEAMELRAEVDGQIFGEQRARAQVVPVGKAAWDNQEIVVEQKIRGLQQVVDVQEIGGEAHEAAGPGGLTVAVDAGGA